MLKCAEKNQIFFYTLILYSEKQIVNNDYPIFRKKYCLLIKLIFNVICFLGNINKEYYIVVVKV